MVACPALAQITQDDLPFDNQKDRWMSWSVLPVQPISITARESFLFTLNHQGNHLVALDKANLGIVSEVPLGPGLASVVLHPSGLELWCVDRVNSCVSVVSKAQGSVLRTIRVGAEPHGLVFSASGHRAYVSCSQSNTVDVIDTATYSLENSIPIPAKEPRGIARVGNTIWVAPLLSGNNTAPRGNPYTSPADAIEVRNLDEFPALNQLPDRDLFAITISGSPATDAIDPARTRSALGTNLFNVHVRPGTTDLWIPHTDALNGDVRGERGFIAGQVVRNRIAIVDTTSNAPATIVDLDALAPSVEERCGTPTGVAFTSDGSRAFVCGYGSSSIAVLDVDANGVTWAGSINLHQLHTIPVIPANFPGQVGVGPAMAAVSPDDQTLYVFNSGEETITRVPLGRGFPRAPQFVHEAATAKKLGFDPLPPSMRQGRLDFNRTQNSLSNTSSCGSCHLSGKTDGLVWDLGVFLDPETTPGNQLSFPVDAKGPLVTQHTRRLKETGPWHWRGEQKSLFDFDSAFVNLMERHINGQPGGLNIQFNYIERYLSNLALPPNPKQPVDRIYTTEQLAGADLFMNLDLKNGLTCASCHPLPIGSNGEIVENMAGGLAPTGVVPSLRSLHEKLTPPFVVGGEFGTRNELGSGLLHAGTAATLQDVLLLGPGEGHGFTMTANDADKIAAFLEALDSGMAPAATFQGTMHAGNAAAFRADELAYLTSQADAGNCDVIFKYGPVNYMGTLLWFGGQYDPATGDFEQASTLLTQVTIDELENIANMGTPVTFQGVPLMMGKPMGLDRDMDGLYDLDEFANGTNADNFDTDGDTLPDGYEVIWGTDPTAPDVNMTDTVAPTVVAAPTVIYATLHAVKFEFKTNEQAHMVLRIDDGPPILRAPLKPLFDDEFSLVLNGFEPTTTYEVHLDISDPVGNTETYTFPITTASPALPTPVRVSDVSIGLLSGGQGQPYLHAVVSMDRGGLMPQPGYNLIGSVYHVTPSGTPTLVSAQVQTWLVLPSGESNFFVAIPPTVPMGLGDLMFVVQSVDAPPGMPPYARANDVMNSVKIQY